MTHASEKPSHATETRKRPKKKWLKLNLCKWRNLSDHSYDLRSSIKLTDNNNSYREVIKITLIISLIVSGSSIK